MKPPARCKIDPRQLAIGRKIEMEHTNNPKEAETIASHHICEFGSYYTVLPKAERQMAAIDRRVKQQQHHPPIRVQRMPHAHPPAKPSRGRSKR